jgi:hypothetical protein
VNSMWSAARRQGLGFWLVFALSCLGEVLWFLFANIGYFADTAQYLHYASEIHNHQIPYFANEVLGQDFDVTSVARRTLGYPILLLLGGVPQTESFLGILTIQAAMAVAMPLLSYKILEPYGQRIAFATSVVLIITLEPFNYSKTLLSDHPFKFLLLLLIYLAVCAYRQPTRRSFVAIGAVSIMLVLVRPQGSAAVLLVFGFLTIAHRRHFVALAGHLFAVGVILGICNLVVAMYLAAYVPTEMPANMKSRTRSIAADLEMLLLYHAYTSATGDALDPTEGTERSRLKSTLLNYANEHVQDWATLEPAHYFGSFKDDPSKLVDEIYRNPNPFYLNIIKLAIFAPKSRDAGDSNGQIRLWKVIWETYRTEPQLIVSFVTRYLSGSAASSGGQQAWSQYYTTGLSPFGPKNGPASQEIANLVKIYASDFPRYMPAQWRDYPGGVDKMIDDIFVAQPCEAQWYVLWEIVDRLKGRLESGRLFLKSLWEFPDINYLKGFLTIDKLAEIVVGAPSNFRLGKRAYDDGIPEGLLFLFSFDDPSLHKRMAAEIASGVQPSLFHNLIRGGSHYESILRWYTALWLALRNLVNLTVAATILFCFPVGIRWPAALMASTIAGNALAVALTADSYVRYIDHTLPLSITLAGLSVGAFLRGARVPSTAIQSAKMIKSDGRMALTISEGR